MPSSPTASMPVSLERPLRATPSGIDSALGEADGGAPYDRHARIYDRLVGNRLYNRVVWGTDAREYTALAQEAVATGSGPLLDAGCGTAVFTAPVYRAASRPMVLVDRSIGMLEVARARIDGAPVTLLQGDILDLPFAPAQFETVACFGVLHVLDDPWAALAALRPHVAPGGHLYASMLVAGERGTSDRYLRLLEGREEVSAPRTADELRGAASDIFGAGAIDLRRDGAMTYLRASVEG